MRFVRAKIWFKIKLHFYSQVLLSKNYSIFKDMEGNFMMNDFHQIILLSLDSLDTIKIGN